MKTRQTVESRKSKVEGQTKARSCVPCPCPSPLVARLACRAEAERRRAFTLIELLVVIAIIGVIAALLLPLAGAVKRKAYIQNAQSQMAQIETAIGSYKAAYGFYPPDNHLNPANPRVNQLYYELVGTTNIVAPPGNPEYEVLGGSGQKLKGGPGGDVEKIFGVAGFMNCANSAAGGSATRGQDFLPGLKSAQIAENVTNSDDPNVPFTLLVTPVGGPDPAYQPLGIQDVNPWRYNSSNPTNNPGSYDLYVQLCIGGTTNLICNWSKQVQINSSLP